MSLIDEQSELVQFTRRRWKGFVLQEMLSTIHEASHLKHLGQKSMLHNIYLSGV